MIEILTCGLITGKHCTPTEFLSVIGEYHYYKHYTPSGFFVRVGNEITIKIIPGVCTNAFVSLPETGMARTLNVSCGPAHLVGYAAGVHPSHHVHVQERAKCSTLLHCSPIGVPNAYRAGRFIHG